MNKFLIIGLGNIGSEYAGTRHNIGFDVVHAFASRHAGSFAVDRHAYRAEVKWKGKIFVCICPTTFMNLSGKAVKYWLDKEKIAIENCLVVLDDLSLPLDKFRLRSSGSAAGHNGLKDIEASLGTSAYPRLRFGIGNHFPKGLQANFVLGKWRPDELAMVKAKVEKCCDIIESFATIGIDKTMSLANSIQVQANG